MRILGRSLAVASIAVAVATGVAVPADAASAIQIYKVYVNSPGSDNRSNTSLNAEYVALKNVSRSSRSLTRWTIRDKSNHIYTFGAFTLGPGKFVYLHTGSGGDNTVHRYWRSGNYIWNNTGDTAYLRTSGGSLADSCSWGSVSSVKYC